MSSPLYPSSEDDPRVNWELGETVAELRQRREKWRADQRRSNDHDGRELPSPKVIRDAVGSLTQALFPMRLGPADLREESEDFFVGYTLDVALNALFDQARLELDYSARRRGVSECPQERRGRAEDILQGFARALPDIRARLDEDILAAYQGDPAALSVDEVLLCYPGVEAVIHHRLAHYFYTSGLPMIARIISEHAHSATGIDIHPGATIGRSFFIDHGTGVVIGETAIIGDRVRIYQAVTLGAKRFPANEAGHLEKGLERHPIVEDDVVIYAGATILGRITIGRGTVIGGNVWLTRSVPPGSSVTQACLQDGQPIQQIKEL
ncbi:serine O-acetyltransferase EpsC [Halotalea alkalilenta]|uniref:serine O-acetyltransferase n=1 Tax=Halotalea alkalilenta TaxID=376489 RepID=A0A172YIR4_9GAMM|nr:serine O-acetyltransferase EpsC [Halotalea alkalilenta]ANF59089.1 serine acetyltransferase [Halotalea alkalilenta]